MDFFDKGYACIELMDPKFALDVWKDIDPDEIRRFLAEVSEKPWKSLTFPRTPSTVAFLREIDNVSNCSPPKLSWILTSRICTNAGSVTGRNG